MNNVDKDVQSCYYDWIVEGLKGPQEENHKGVKLVFQVLFDINCCQSALFVLVSR